MYMTKFQKYKNIVSVAQCNLIFLSLFSFFDLDLANQDFTAAESFTHFHLSIFMIRIKLLLVLLFRDIVK